MQSVTWSVLRRLVAALVLLVAGVRASAAEELAARTYTDAAGKTIPYRLLVPKDYDAKQKYPLVIFFHGAGERGADNAKQLVHGVSLFTKAENRQKFPCFLMAPQCPAEQQWVDMPWSGDSGKRLEKPSEAMRLALEAMEAVYKEFSVDRDRLYVTGLSMGGYATWDCITRYPDRFAAAVPICGGGDETTVNPAAAKVPVWAFHSDDDNVVKVIRTRNMIRAMRQAGGAPKYFEYSRLGHFSWGAAYGEPELLPWMFAQRLGKPDRYELKTPAPEVPAVARFPDVSEFPGKGPLRTADWFRNVWRERRMYAWKNRETEKGAVVFLGDSITQGWGSLAKDFPNLKVANRGISGDVTRGVLYRLKEDVLDLNPRAVVLLIGTNDLEEQAEPELIAGNIKEILARLKAHDPKMPVIVCKVMPSHESKRRPADKIRRLNELVDELVKADAQFIRCDTWSIFADQQGNAKEAEFPDLLHPNAAGYRKFADAVRPILDRLGLVKPQAGQWRGVHVMVHGDGPAAQLIDELPQLAALGINTLIVEINYGFEYDSHPELRSAGFLTKKQARVLADACRQHGIRPIPMFNCLGHQSWAGSTFTLLTKYPQFDETPGKFPKNEGIYCRSWCPQHPEVNPIIFALMDELIDAFAADAFHVGMDEVFLIGSEHCSRCKGKVPAELFARAVNDYHAHLVGKRKLEMLMWGDRLLDGKATGYGEWEAATNGTHPAIDRIPKDIIQCDWHYTKRADYPSIPLFIEKGFRVWPGGWNKVDATLALIEFAKKHQGERMLGHLFTTWGSVKMPDLAEWPPIVEGMKAVER